MLVPKSLLGTAESNVNRNVKEVAKAPGPLDSDGDAISMTPSSPSSFLCSSSSGVDELEYVDDDDDVKGREQLQDRKKKNITSPFTIGKSGCPDAEAFDNCQCPKCLYYATPRLDPLKTTTDPEPLDLGPPPSPCDSCSSTHAESIPTAKRSSVRVPITPTSPTADAEDADTEKTDVERKQRERRNRVPTLSAFPNPFKRA